MIVGGSSEPMHLLPNVVRLLLHCRIPLYDALTGRKVSLSFIRSATARLGYECFHAFSPYCGTRMGESVSECVTLTSEPSPAGSFPACGNFHALRRFPAAFAVIFFGHQRSPELR